MLKRKSLTISCNSCNSALMQTANRILSLPYVPFLFHKSQMERINPLIVSEAILTAPDWARVGVATPDKAMRQKAAQEIADGVIRALAAQTDDDRCQLALPL